MDDAEPFELAVPVRLSCGAEVEVPLEFCDDLFYLDLLDQLTRAVRGIDGEQATHECVRLVRRLSDYIDPGAAIARARHETPKRKQSAARRKFRRPRL